MVGVLVGLFAGASVGAGPAGAVGLWAVLAGAVGILKEAEVVSGTACARS